jgi:phosphoribosylglycinamide formyltransferase-1
MKRIVILVSGRGSNLAAIATACTTERWPARIALVICNRPQADALRVARAHGIATEVVDDREFADRSSFDAALGDAIERHAPDVVALAGFMRILTPEFVRRFEGRLLNVHPSLLPAFTGLATHRRVLEAGCKLSGATVHFVTPDLDHGPIVIQAAVQVQPDDTEATLAGRVLGCEHRIYPRALRWFLHDELQVQDGRVKHRDGEVQWLA